MDTCKDFVSHYRIVRHDFEHEFGTNLTEVLLDEFVAQRSKMLLARLLTTEKDRENFVYLSLAYSYGYISIMRE